MTSGRTIATASITLTVAILFVIGNSPLASGSNLFADEGLAARTITFESDVQPLLTRLGCNAGACHGKSRGQNGFALSLLGFDANFDYASIVEEARGRGLFPAAPEK